MGQGWGGGVVYQGPAMSCHQPAGREVKDASDWGHCLVKSVCLGIVLGKNGKWNYEQILNCLLTTEAHSLKEE